MTKENNLHRFHEINNDPFHRWFTLLELADLPQTKQTKLTLGDSSHPIKTRHDPDINFAEGGQYTTFGWGNGISYEQLILDLKNKTFRLSNYARPNITKQNNTLLFDTSWHSLNESDVLSIGNIDVLINFLPKPQLINPFHLMRLKEAREKHEGLLQIQDYVKTTKVGEKEYPLWAINKAQRIIEKYGGNLESMMESVMAVTQAIRNAQKADPNEPGRAFSHNIGGYLIRSSDDKNHD